MSLDFERVTYNQQGLVPAVIQDCATGEVLMLAYMNAESLRKTLDTGETYFWSRSRKQIWHKGATSGHVQRVRRIAIDCDSDALLVQVEQVGVACHTGNRSCFFEESDRVPGAGHPISDVLGRLSRVIGQRHVEMPDDSYTTKLFIGGMDRILKKVGEESGEVIIAAKNRNKQEITWEVSDLLYHLLVMLEYVGVSIADVAGELERRFHKPKA